VHCGNRRCGEIHDRTELPRRGRDALSPVLAGDDGIVTVKSAYPIGETVERLKRDIADKGIKFFQ